MGSTKKFWKGMFLGAAIGAAISLFDRETRKSVIESCKKGTKEVSYYVLHPNEMAEKVKDKTEQLRASVEQISEDISYITGKVEELKETAPAVADIVKETKEAFLDDKKQDEQ